jgi:transcriptional regulator with XRE-family HTH domain
LYFRQLVVLYTVSAYLREPLIIIAFGERLRELRKKAGMSQEELAHSAGIAVSQVGRIERGELNLSISTMSALAKALRVLPKELFDSGDGTEKHTQSRKRSQGGGFAKKLIHKITGDGVEKKKRGSDGVSRSPAKEKMDAVRALVKKKLGVDGDEMSKKEAKKKLGVDGVKEKFDAVRALVKKKLGVDGDEMPKYKAKQKLRKKRSSKKKRKASA